MAYKSVLSVALLAVCFLPAERVMGQALVDGFEVYNSVALPGRLYVPADYTPTKSYPIVVFLHGAGQEGTDDVQQVENNISNLIANAASRDFFIYAPQDDRGIWSPDDDLPAIAKMLGQMTTQYNIDPDRIYATGLSLGGQGVNFMIDDYTNLYAAFIPLSASGGGLTPAEAEPAVGRPIWYFHGNADTTVTVDTSRDTVNNILADEGQPPLTSWASASVPTFNFSYNNLHYTEYNGAGHDNTVWNDGAYADADMYNWMLAQSNPIKTPGPGQTIYINFSQDLLPTQTDGEGRMWNNAGSGVNSGYVDPITLAVTVPFAVDSTGARTTVQMAVSKTFFNETTKYPSQSTVYDSFVAQSYWEVGSFSNPSGNPGQLTFSGLTPFGVYNMQILASIADNYSSKGYYGDYSAGGVSEIFNGANLGGTFDLNDVTADASGDLVLSVTAVDGSNFAVINALTLNPIAVPEPSTAALVVIGSGLLTLRRRRQLPR